MVESLPAADSGEADKMRARLELIVTVDPTIYVRPNTKIPCPVDTPPRRFALTRATTMIGRFSERRDTVPEIALGDPGISRRHAAVVQETDGTVTLSDVGSTNGTQINGKDVMPGSRVALCAGDEIVIGFWTRITVRPAVGLPP
jgi:hypothetical protein